MDVAKAALLLLLTPLGLGSPYPPTPSAPIVDLGYSQYQGVLNTKGNIDFLGIRYAAPPVGDLRFRAPRPPAKVEGLQFADRNPNMCLQGTIATNSRSPWGSEPVLPMKRLENSLTSPNLTNRRVEVPPTSEDCLFLNVVVPGRKLSPNAKLPVVVFIHGGGYALGSASYPTLDYPTSADGNDLVAIAKGKAIAVLIQYRLGLFGFLASAEVRENGDLNAGLLDQEYALRWVQTHIRKFGGDSQRVTIWGVSAGAGSVLQHLIANNGQTNPPLFYNAILSSVFVPSQYRYSDRVPEELYGRVLAQAGCETADNRLRCLRGKDSKILESINIEVGQNGGFWGTLVFVPVVDGKQIRDRPSHLLRQGKFNKANVLAVTNRVEGFCFVNQALMVNTTDYISQLFPQIPSSQLPEAAELYTGFGSAYDQAVAIMGEAIFVCPNYPLLRALQRKGYKGEYAVPPAHHGSDVIYYFPSLRLPNATTFDNEQFITTYGGAFLDFAITQRPNANRPGSILPFWPRWSPGSPNEVVFNRAGNLPDISVQETHAALLQRCSFWNSVSQYTAQ